MCEVEEFRPRVPSTTKQRGAARGPVNQTNPSNASALPHALAYRNRRAFDPILVRGIRSKISPIRYLPTCSPHLPTRTCYCQADRHTRPLIVATRYFRCGYEAWDHKLFAFTRLCLPIRQKFLLWLWKRGATPVHSFTWTGGTPSTFLVLFAYISAFHAYVAFPR